MDEGHETFVNQTPSFFLGMFRCVVLALALHFLIHVDGLAQSSMITTYVGPSLPVAGTQATTQAFDSPVSVAPRADGGFYFASSKQNRVYGVGADGTLMVVAGTGAAGFSGDGGPAISAQLHEPQGLAVDAEGNLFIADYLNQRIRKITNDGVIKTAVGDGRRGAGGDGGPAESAQLNGPQGVAVDMAGNLFSPAGVITTLSGTGRVYAGGDFSGDGGPAVLAQLQTPSAIAIDPAGNLLIADTGNHRIRKISPDGIITTVAGSGVSGFRGDGGPAEKALLNVPVDLAMDSAGNLVIAEYSGHRVRKVSPSGIVTTVAGTGVAGFGGDGGSAVEALFNRPAAVAVDAAGNLFIADSYNHRIRKVTLSGTVTTVAGTGVAGFGGDGGPAILAHLNQPRGVAFDPEGNMIIADDGNHRIRKMSQDGIMSTIAGNGAAAFSGDGGPAVSAGLNSPRGLAVDSAGNIFVATPFDNRIRKVEPSGIITTVTGTGIPGFSGDGGPAPAAQVHRPADIYVDSFGNLWIADTFNQRIRMVSPDGVITTVVGNGIPGFSGDGGPPHSAQFWGVNSMVTDSRRDLFIADGANHRIRKVTMVNEPGR